MGVGMAEGAVHFAYAERGDYATWGALFATTTSFLSSQISTQLPSHSLVFSLRICSIALFRMARA